VSRSSWNLNSRSTVRMHRVSSPRVCRGMSSAIDQCAYGGDDKGDCEIEQNFCSHAQREGLGEQNIQLIRDGQQAPDDGCENEVTPEDISAE